jgi:integrase
MGIYLRQKQWWYCITVKGKEHRGSCKTQDRQQAQEIHDRLRAEVWRGRVVKDVQKHTLSEAIDRFLRERGNKRSWKDDQRYGDWWKEQLRSAQVILLEDVTPDVVADIRDEELGKVAPATVNRKLAFLRSVINAAHREWMWLEQAPKFRLVPGEVTRRRFLTPEEVERLVRALARPYADMALLSVATGLRQGNVLGLKWGNVNLATRRLTLPDEVMKNGLPFSCPLNETAVSVLRKWLGRHDEYVFSKERISGVPSKMWARALKDAGLVDVRWHDLRHTWASLMRQAGVGLDDLQELGGWESRTMVQRYAHLDVGHLAPKAAALDGMLLGKKKAEPYDLRTVSA